MGNVGAYSTLFDTQALRLAVKQACGLPFNENTSWRFPQEVFEYRATCQ
jgi:hypothetical protein